jgi:tetratricopeptide (TPR) repeat protein
MNNNFLSSFTPSLMSSQTLEAIFVQRHKIVEHLIELVRDSSNSKNKHFRLLIGMRGIGKTHTIALIYHRLKQQNGHLTHLGKPQVACPHELQDKLLIAWLKEEEWGVSSWLDLLLSIFKALAIEYPAEYNTQFKSQIENLYQLSADDATRQAETILKDFIGKKTLLLLTENLDEIFNSLGESGQKQFRAYLQNHNLITIIATSQSLFSGVSDRDSPFYGFFTPEYLAKLTREEATNLLTKIAELQKDKELETFIQSPIGKDRIQAIHHLAGGNHRVYIIFSQFLTRQSLDELVQPVMQTLDELTPYYQAKMQWLSPQQRKIIELLCDCGNAITVKEIAQRCFITHQTASSQLKDLRAKGYVTAESFGRESFYELQEPLMRICLEVKKQRGEPIKLFIDFLRIWYTEKELQQRLEMLPLDCLEREYIYHALKSKEEFLTGNLEVGSLDNNLIYRGIEEGIAENNQKALELFEQAIKKNSNDYDAWYCRGRTLYKLGKVEEAIASFDKAIEINTNDYYVWYCRGFTLYQLDKLEEALASYDKAIQINSDLFFSAYFNRIELLLKLNRWEEGFKDLDNALNRFADAEEFDEEYTEGYIKIIWESTTDFTIWKSRLETLVSIYNKHQIVSVLTIGVINHIPILMSDIVSNKAARNWLETWQSISGDKVEFAIALRFLKTAVEYKESKGSRKILLQLPKEERELLEELLAEKSNK